MNRLQTALHYKAELIKSRVADGVSSPTTMGMAKNIYAYCYYHMADEVPFP